MDKHLQYSIDQLLLEQGEYTALEWLLAEGRLLYHDYEAWRQGDVARLDQALFGDPSQIRQLLHEAQHYCLALGLQADTLCYTRWGGDGGAPLRFSDDTAWEHCFHTRYRQSAQQPQMDLFMDAPGNSLAIGVQQALVNRDPATARHLLERLYDTEPSHARLAGLDVLVSAEMRLTTEIADIETELDYVRNTLAPVANDALGRNARSVLVPHWRRLDIALQHTPFDPDKPHLHSSYAASQALDWASARAAVERETDWRRQPTLLQRHAIACTRLNQHTAALGSWFMLCWHYPDHADAVSSDADHQLQSDWRAFFELEPELPIEDFPAWLVLHQATLINRLPAPNEDDVVNASYAVIYQLQQHRANASPDTSDIALRSRLKQLNPPLFEHVLIQLGKNID